MNEDGSVLNLWYHKKHTDEQSGPKGDTRGTMDICKLNAFTPFLNLQAKFTKCLGGQYYFAALLLGRHY